MIALKIEGATHIMSAPPDRDDVYPLHIKLVRTEDGTHYSVSRWEPTPEELEQLKNGGSVELWVMGRQPPVALMVAPHPDTERKPDPSIDGFPYG